MNGVPAYPGLDRLVLVARALGDLRERVVFIGGAIAPMLQTDPPFHRPRITSDVDAIIASASYTNAQHLHNQLATLGFRPDLSDPRHVNRWIAGGSIPFDLVPAGEHLGAAAGIQDRLAIETAMTTLLAPGLEVRHASAPGFLGLKWAAYDDRGSQDPLNSDDLQDILALLASRPTVLEELTAAPAELRAYVGEKAGAFLESRDVEDLLAAHLNNAQDPAHTIAVVRVLLERLARQ